MRFGARILLVLVGLVVPLVTVVLVRTATFRPPESRASSTVQLAPARPVDLDRAARHLSEAVQIQTVSHQRADQNDWSQWDRLHEWLEATYPAAHAQMTRDVVAGHTLVYTWTGIDESLPAVILMAHQDVVPVTPRTERDWKHAPFAGDIAENAVWGRGSIDDKSSLVAMFEGLETLAAGGFVPRRTLIVVSGHDEETGGAGARAAAQWLSSRGVRAQFVLDEGLAVVSDLPLVDRPAALIGIAEKGYATLRVTAPAAGGHSSAPPKETGVETLARGVLAITDRTFPMRFDGPAADMIRALAPYGSRALRMAVANEWLFRHFLIKQIAATPAGASALHTTIAPTMLRGSPKENVLPQDATAWINYRISPGTTAADVMQRAREATDDLPLEFAWEGPAYDPPPVSSSTSGPYRVLAALASDGGRTPVAPGLVTATTDSRSFVGLATDVYRFQPIVASLRDFEMIHGTNEHLTLDNLRRAVEFYTRLVATACR